MLKDTLRYTAIKAVMRKGKQTNSELFVQPAGRAGERSVGRPASHRWQPADALRMDGHAANIRMKAGRNAPHPTARAQTTATHPGL